MSCESCRHKRKDHGEDGKGKCEVQPCGCYGYWPNMKARYCDNPKCEGGNCVEARSESRPRTTSRKGSR